MHAYRCLVVALLLVVGATAQGNRKCAQNGEYCLTHSECCSGSCLSFSYKCVPVPPSASVGTIQVPEPIATDNRFGAADTAGTSITQKTCALLGEYCLTHAECCSGTCLSFSYKCIQLSPSGAAVTAPSNTPAPLPVSTTASLGNRFGDEGTSTTPKKCAQIGEYCLTHNDCCSGSCLSFSYKCVTVPGGGQQAAAPLPVQSVVSDTELANRFDGSTDSATTQPKCAAIGEYCLTSADCCSKSCLSFAYKCVSSYGLTSQQANTGLATANRFGGAQAPGAPQRCNANGHYCAHNGECCSGACYKSVCSTEIRIGVPEQELTRPSVVNGPYVPVNSLDDLITRFGGVPSPSDNSASATSRTQSNVARVARQCRSIGDGCNRQEDCCTLKCHSYRRKCVT